MNIAYVKKYIDKITGEESGFLIAEIDGDVITVPKSINNRHYAEIMRQVQAGELTIQDAD